MSYVYCKIQDLLGCTFTSVKADSGVFFYDAPGRLRFKMGHEQDCCESVDLVDVCGDLEDITGSPITMAEEVSGCMESELDFDAMTKAGECPEWTFYKIGTIKGSVTLCWFGDSNGYYSTSVDIFDHGKE